MKYKSHRNLIDFLVGLVKGVGKFYKEDLKVSKLSNDKVEIVFPQQLAEVIKEAKDFKKNCL